MRTPACIVSILGTAWIIAMPALGQSTSNASARARESIVNLEEVVVTASKRGEQSLADVPLTLSVFQGTVLEHIGADSMSAYLQKAPGVGIMETQPGNNIIQIRGISALAGDATVGFYLDDLPYILPGSGVLPDVRSYDLERVEVLRGPQGTLYGASSEGGTIRILTRNPDLNAFEAKGALTNSWTRDGGQNRVVDGAVSVPLVEDKFAVRGVAGYSDLSGWIDDPISGGDDLNSSRIGNYRLKALLKPVDDLSITGSAWFSRIDNDAPNSADSEGNRPLVGSRESASYDYDLYNAAIQYDLPHLSFFNAASFMSSVQDTHPVLPVNAHTVIDAETWTDEFRITSKLDGPFNFLAGAFYADIKEDVDVDVFLPTPVAFQRDNWRTKQWSVFSEVYFSPSGSKAQFTAGLRYFHDDRSILNNIPTQLALFNLLGLPNPREATFHSTDPRFNAAYRFSENILGYVNVAKGFRSGGLQPGISLLSAGLAGVLDQIPLAADPESLWTYEIGSRMTSLCGGKLDLEAAVYFTEWKDIIVVLPLSGQPVAYALNGPKAHSYGIDFNMLVRPAAGLDLSLGGNVNRAEFASTLGIFQSGQPIDNVPDATFHAAIDYRRPFIGGLSGFAHLDAQYNALRHLRSFVTGPPAVVINTRSDTLTLVNLRFGLQSERWAAALFADNVFDEGGAITAYAATVTPLAASGFAATPRPRTVGVNLSIRY